MAAVVLHLLVFLPFLLRRVSPPSLMCWQDSAVDGLRWRLRQPAASLARYKTSHEETLRRKKTLDNQKNTGAGGLGIVANNMDDPIPYIGITTTKIIGGDSRYSSLSIRGANSEIIATDKLSTIQGAESAIIALNTYGVNYKAHLGNLNSADVRAGTRIANLRFTHKQLRKINAGINLLDRIRPGWDKATGENSLLFPENKRGTNNPNP